jgi:agmatine deiminase
MSSHPRDAGFRQPAEWTPHRACWVAYPSDPELWPDLRAAQDSFARMCRGIAHAPPGQTGEGLDVLVQDGAARAQAEMALAGLPVRFHELRFGDIWMRDIAPVFLQSTRGEVASVRFIFNGWGAKYLYPGDDLIAAEVQARSGLKAFASSLVCEGGGLEVDGAGLCLTTREVVLNENRNPGLTQQRADALLCDALGVERVLWLGQGLLNDHTDGHIDNIARFVGEGRALCMHAVDANDPNRDVLHTIERELRAADLDVVSIPSPGLVLGRDGKPLPASYCNFYIANHSVVVPVFGSKHDERALRAIEQTFPGRKVIEVPALVFLQEGGTVHCITQQEPLAS